METVVQGQGQINITAPSDPYAHGDEITLKAIPEAGWRLSVGKVM
ncbi:MAG: hypothetical protein R2932_25225 [Caldilineaceae bacterium]